MKLKYSIPLILLIVFAGYLLKQYSLTEGLFILIVGLIGAGLAEFLVKKITKKKAKSP
jgi:F0F1-type ATP synthase assembly protein I